MEIRLKIFRLEKEKIIKIKLTRFWPWSEKFSSASTGSDGCGSIYIEIGSGTGILAQFGSGSRSESGSRSRVILSILKLKKQNNLREK